jgi:hypothetical protein
MPLETDLYGAAKRYENPALTRRFVDFVGRDGQLFRLKMATSHSALGKKQPF